jgi:carboxypeptidase PM20D1
MQQPIQQSSLRRRLRDARAFPPSRASRALPPLAILASLTLGMYALKPASRPARPSPFAPPASEIPLLEGAAERLAESIRIPTISHASPDAFDAEAFEAFHAHLQEAFPRAHAAIRREVVAEHSLLYTWGGSDPSLLPILLMGHLDAVPVEEQTRGEWREDPFGGRIADGFIWGRGAIDNKSAVVGTLEAVELLLSEGYRPARTIYLAYGHDEEVGGTRGARAIAELLRARGVRLAMVLDEGGVIADGILPGVDSTVALVGIAEKGFLSLELTSRALGGHSSLPPRQSAIGVLGAAVARLEEHPMPARLEGATSQMFSRVSPAPLTRAPRGRASATTPARRTRSPRRMTTSFVSST